MLLNLPGLPAPLPARGKTLKSIYGSYYILVFSGHWRWKMQPPKKCHPGSCTYCTPLVTPLECLTVPTSQHALTNKADSLTENILSLYLISQMGYHFFRHSVLIISVPRDLRSVNLTLFIFNYKLSPTTQSAITCSGVNQGRFEGMYPPHLLDKGE